MWPFNATTLVLSIPDCNISCDECIFTVIHTINSEHSCATKHKKWLVNLQENGSKSRRVSVKMWHIVTSSLVLDLSSVFMKSRLWVSVPVWILRRTKQMEKKGPHRGFVKTRVPHKEIFEQSLKETVKYRDKENNKRCPTRVYFWESELTLS